MSLTVDLFGAAFGAIVSILFSWTPYLRVKFAEIQDEYKKLVMLGISLAVAGFMLASSYFGWWQFITWDKAGWMQMAEVWFFFLLANQTIYKLTPQFQDVKVVKALKENDGIPGIQGY